MRKCVFGIAWRVDKKEKGILVYWYIKEIRNAWSIDNENE